MSTPSYRRPAQRKCVFCGNGKLTGEHLWSQWMRELLPRSEGFLEFSNRNRGGKAVDHRLLRDSQGAIVGKKIKRVCGACNSGWMSRLEVEVAPTVTGLIQAQADILTKAVRRPLVEWLVMKLMVVDAMRDGEQAFLQSERHAFFERRAIPSSLSVWLLRCGEAPWTNAFKCNAQGVSVYLGGKPEEVRPVRPGTPNLKLFVWGIGQALITACYHRDVDLEFDMENSHAIRLLPDQNMGRAWPPQPISAQEVEELTKSLQTMPEKLGARYFELPDAVRKAGEASVDSNDLANLRGSSHPPPDTLAASGVRVDEDDVQPL